MQSPVILAGRVDFDQPMQVRPPRARNHRRAHGLRRARGLATVDAKIAPLTMDAG